MIPHFGIIQGSEKWLAIRRGRPTASRFDSIITAKTGVLSKGIDGYIDELIAECFVQDEGERPPTFWEQRGLELEPDARKAFEAKTNLNIKNVGFVTRDDEVVGCSPDSLVELAGEFVATVEIKCPMAKTHVSYMRAGVLPDDYRQQVHGTMAITGFDHAFFFSYYPGMKPFCIRVERDDYTEKVSIALDEFVIMYQAAREKVIPLLKLK